MNFRFIKQTVLILLLLPTIVFSEENIQQPSTNNEMQIVNISNDGSLSDKGGNFVITISSDGNLVAFSSDATNLVTNPEKSWVESKRPYLRDISNQQTSIIAPKDNPIDGLVDMPKISEDGQFISFWSKSEDLITNDTNNQWDVFVYELATGNTTLISIASDGAQANGISYPAGFSSNGRFVLFMSSADNLVANDTNETPDLFLHDRETHTTTRESLGTGGAQLNGHSGMMGMFLSNQISADGRYIIFNTIMDNQASTWAYYLRDRQTNTTKLINPTLCDSVEYQECTIHSAVISANGKYIAYHAYYKPIDGSNYSTENFGLYMYDIESNSHNLIAKGPLEPLTSIGVFPSISADGRYTVFSCLSCSDLPAGKNDFHDVYVYDRILDQFELVSKSYDDTQNGNDHSSHPVISADGSAITFLSHASNIIPNDDNGFQDYFWTKNPLFNSQASYQIDLSIDKSASTSEIEIGKNITYTLTIDNISIDAEATATEVSVEDVLPEGLTFDSVTPPEDVTCSENSGTVSCDLGDIAVSDPSISIEIVGKTTAKGEIKNTATVTASETDSDTSNNSSEATITVIELTDVYINGSIDDSVTYYIGDELTYSFEVGNNSANPATDVTAIITLPTAFSSITASTDVDNSTCSVNDTKITCIFGDDIEQTDKANIIVKATPSAAGDFDVDAQVTTAKTDSDNDNNSDTATVAVKPKSDLAISIEDSDDPDGSIYAGTNLTYTITVKNNGPSDATNIKITDTLPTGVTFVSASSSCAQAAGEVICNIDDIANGASKSVNVVIKPTTPGTITNEVTVSATEHDHVETNNSKSEDTLVKAVADLQITSVSASPIPPSLVLTGNELTYTFKIKNNGINGATEVLLKDTLPDSMEFVSAGSSPDCTEAAGEVTCNIGDLANGADIDINIVVKPTKPGIFTNKATTSAKEHDPVDNNEKSIDVDVKAVTDMELVSASATPNPVYAGANLTYDVTIRNNAAEFNTATGIKVTYTFYDNIILDSASSCTAVGNVVTCFVNDMVYNTTKDIQLVIQPDMDGDLEADIEVISITHDPDTSEDSNSKSITTAVTPAVDIVVTMLESADPILVGQDLTYTITVKNNGPSTAINVVLQDILPAAAPVQSFVTSQGTCINNLTTFDCDIGDLANDDSVKITLVLRPTNGAAGTLINEATVSSDVYERATTPDNNVASVTTTVNQSSKVKVSLKGKGSGTVDITVNGTTITCPGDCEGVFTRGDSVTLKASSSFDRWQGGVCSGKNNICEFTLDKPNMNVMASFK